MTVTLNKLRFYAYHGALPQERVVGGDYEVTLRVTLPATPAACEHDQLCGTVNYADLYQLVKSEMAIPANLLEHVAWRIGKAVRSHHPEVESVSVSITKVNPPIGAACQGATVELTL